LRLEYAKEKSVEPGEWSDRVVYASSADELVKLLLLLPLLLLLLLVLVLVESVVDDAGTKALVISFGLLNPFDLMWCAAPRLERLSAWGADDEDASDMAAVAAVVAGSGKVFDSTASMVALAAIVVALIVVAGAGAGDGRGRVDDSMVDWAMVLVGTREAFLREGDIDDGGEGDLEGRGDGRVEGRGEGDKAIVERVVVEAEGAHTGESDEAHTVDEKGEAEGIFALRSTVSAPVVKGLALSIFSLPRSVVRMGAFIFFGSFSSFSKEDWKALFGVLEEVVMAGPSTPAFRLIRSGVVVIIGAQTAICSPVGSSAHTVGFLLWWMYIKYLTS
jgi:hypothetical protein